MTSALVVTGRSHRSVRALAAIDPSRIAAESGTLAINLAILMLLLAPVAAPLAVMERPRDIVVVPVRPARVEPPPPPTVPVQVQRDPPPRTQTPSTQAVPIRPTTDVAAPALDLPAAAIDPPAFGPPHGREMAPVSELGASHGAGARLQHLSAPPPPYPRQALKDGVGGTVMLEVVVDVDGRPIEVRIARSSGHRELDQAARRQVLNRWRFQPAMVDGRAVRAVGLVPVEFALD